MTFNGETIRLNHKNSQQPSEITQKWGGEQFTIHLWIVYRNFLADTTSLVYKRSAQEGEYDFQILMNGSITSMGHPSVCLFRFTGEKIAWKDDAAWQMIWTDIDPLETQERSAALAITFDGTTLRSYVNGEINTETALDIGALKDSGTSIVYGYDDQSNINAKECLINDFFIQPRAFSAEEIKALYLDGKPSDSDSISTGVDSLLPQRIAKEFTLDPEFVDPPNTYRPIQYSMNRTPDTELLASYGIGGVVLAAFHKNYMEEEHDWDRLRSDLKKALDAQFSVWLYDEDLYPTGGAGGLTVKDHPEYEMRGMFQTRLNGEGTDEFAMNLPEIGEKFIGAVLYPVSDTGSVNYDAAQMIVHEEKIIRGNGIPGPWVLCAYIQRVVRDNHATELRKNYWAHGGLYPNLLDPDATDRYLEVTHQQYKDKFGEDFKRIIAFYTGEPVLWTMNAGVGNLRPEGECLLPWTTSFPEAFEGEHGYNVFIRLGEIFDAPYSESCQARYHFFKTVGTLLTKNFFVRYADWCEKNGSALSGHLLFEEELASHVPLYGNIMQCTSVFQLAGMDYYIYNHGVEYKQNIMTMKYTLSARRHKGDYLAQGLYEPICSGCYFPKNHRLIRPTLSVMRANANQMFAGGVSVINNYGPYTIYGQEPYRRFADYTSRLCYLLRGFRDEAKIAVYYNIETIQAKYRPNPHSAWARIHNEPFDHYAREHMELGKNLFESSYHFNFLDDYAFEDVTVEENTLRIAGYAYEIMIMPSMDILPLSVFEKLKQFESGGGCLIWLKDLPYMGRTTQENEAVAALSVGYHPLEEGMDIREVLRKRLTERIRIGKAKPSQVSYFSFVRDSDGTRRHLIINRTHRNTHTRIHMASASAGVLYDPDQGRTAEVPGEFDVVLAPYSAVVIQEGVL